MAEAARIADELSRAVHGDPWHGDAVMTILGGVSAASAAARPPGGAHSVWEIVRHMTAWTNEVHRRLDGHPPGEPQEGDWPAPSGATAEDWTNDVRGLRGAHRRLIDRVTSLSDATLHAEPSEARNRPAGSGVSLYVLLHGLAQHHAYHGGQIAVLKKIVSAAAAKS
jgi:uncharacterized damage-inducible protein DinB